MSYTTPGGQPQGNALQVTNKLREILVAKIVAINGYQTHIAGASEIDRVRHTILLDEKKHFGLIFALLQKYDPAQSGRFPALTPDTETPAGPAREECPAGNGKGLLNGLREDIKAELEAVILYEEELHRFPYQDVRTALQTIVDEDKGHAERLTQLLFRFDPDPYGDADNGG